MAKLTLVTSASGESNGAATVSGHVIARFLRSTGANIFAAPSIESSWTS